MSAAPGARTGTLRLTKGDARRLLVRWHMEPAEIPGVFDRHASVQFDPLKPLGNNVDLVLQARVPGYRVDDWQGPVYGERVAFDGWDKQASLVRMQDWPRRRIFHRWHREHWHERVFDRHPGVVADVLEELRERGPLTTTDFGDARRRAALEGSWHGPSLTKHALRALWHTGQVATHHRRHGHHVYDVAERVIPQALLAEPEPSDHEQLRFLVEARHRGAGLLRPNAPKPLWSLEIGVAERTGIIDELVSDGRLVRIDVEGTAAHAPPSAVAALDDPRTFGDEVRFLAPLDPLLWDRAAVAAWFGFDYVWEVYKPEKERTWGYYVLPVLWGDRLVARFDARCTDGTFHLNRFWIEDDVELTATFYEALETGFTRFLAYLRADDVRQNPSAHAVARTVRDALYAAASQGAGIRA